MKWHEVVVHKNIFKDCVKHVAMQRCHIVQWHGELKRSGKAGMQFRTTSVQDDPMWKTTQINSLLPCWTRWAARKLAAEIGVCNKTVLHILYDILGYRKHAARWIPHDLKFSEVQQ